MKKSTVSILAAALVSCYVFGFYFLFERIQPSNGTGSEGGTRLRTRKSKAIRGEKLAVVVPVHAGDATRSFDSLAQWPAVCAESTMHNVDLVIYHAEDVDEGAERLRIPKRASKCFRTTRVVSARLTYEENVYPIGPSAQFFKIFLEPSVREHFTEYAALAIIEWDVVVAHDTSFDRLYTSAFYSSEPFWVKGSVLAGTEFHETASSPDMWHILGHFNGNAIYNNTDPSFVEFVNYAFSRWGYFYPYDVALWATISDLPYTWTLWQRYSSKFVPTNMISNVGFYDVSDDVVLSAFAADTLFIHGSSKSGGRVWNIGETGDGTELSVSAEGCNTACLTRSKHAPFSDVSTVCDATCLSNNPLYESRFRGYNCGVGNPSKYGEGCRRCYMNRSEALVADESMATADTSTSQPDIHVVMCNTLKPPEAMTCSKPCDDDQDTICDRRCGSGRYGDFHCNWRGLGEGCRFCFHDVAAARVVDEIAKQNGGRVIMCDTHEPPQPTDTLAKRLNEVTVTTLDEAGEVDERHALYGDPGVDGFPGGLKRTHICAFIPGYFEFLSETDITVSSIVQFMPGMRIVIATHPMDFHVYNRTLGQVSAVSIVNASRVEFAALDADLACGVESRLIYYMSPGQVLSRMFTRKDTHTPLGQLLVGHVDVERVGEYNARRSMAATCLLGYKAPSFTYGADLILPAATNADLRNLLLRRTTGVTDPRDPGEDDAAKDVHVDFSNVLNLMGATAEQYGKDAIIHIPELLAALSYMQNPDEVQFTNLRQWSHRHIFEDVSVWDVPLVKPLFSCSVDVSLSMEGYDVAASLRERLNAFSHGARCDEGFLRLDRAGLQTKRHWEFGVQDSVQAMPDIKDFNISVMYRTFFGDVDLFSISLPTVIDRFPDALEVVVVVEERDEELFESIVSRHRALAPFPLRIVVEPSLMDGHIQQKYSKMRADIYTKGDYVLHLDSDVVVFEKVTYDHIFHLGKPVLPFRRYRVETFEGEEISWCWKAGTSLAIGEDVVHEFSIFNTHVYPRKMYSALREFIENRHGSTFLAFMSRRRGMCTGQLGVPLLTPEQRTLLLSDFNLIGAFLWYHMHDAVHWMATDPLDIDPDDWRRDITKYAWVCQANGRFYPKDAAGQQLYMENYLAVRSAAHCRILTELWLRPEMYVPETRTYLDTTEWG